MDVGIAKAIPREGVIILSIFENDQQQQHLNPDIRKNAQDDHLSPRDPQVQNGTPCKVIIFEVAHRSGYELTTRAGPDRPVYVGSREWQQQQAGRPISPGFRIPLSAN